MDFMTGTEMRSTSIIRSVSPSKTNAKLAIVSAWEFKYLPTCSIYIALKSLRRVFTIAKYLAILALRASNFSMTYLATSFELLKNVELENL